MIDTTIKPYIDTHQPQFIASLTEFLKIPSVSTNPKQNASVSNCADWLVTHLTQIGLTDVHLHPTAQHPIITAEWGSDPTLPTVLIYGHYDVQPEDPVSLWDSDPFEPTIRDGYIYARGASDNKGQIMCHINAIESWLNSHGKLPVNIKLLIEGEEEIGSPNLFPFLDQHAKSLQSDIVLVSDSPMIAKDQPSICLSLRGLICLEIELKSMASDRHSGQHGGLAPNAIHVLTRIMSQLKDENNQITVPGFYDQVETITPFLESVCNKIPFSVSEYQDMLGTSTLISEPNIHPLACLWYRPTLEWNGIYGGYTGDGVKTVIPATATTKLSCRLVANQDPDTILAKLKAHLHDCTPSGFQLTIKNTYTGCHPIQVDPKIPAVAAAEKALTIAFNVPPMFQGEGGSIPIIHAFKETLGIDTILMGLNLPDDNIHAPNERFRIEDYIRGTIASATFFDEFAKTHNTTPKKP